MSYSQSMTLSDIVTEVQSLRFTGGDATQIQRWVNDRYAALWNADEWIFKYTKANVAATAGSNQIGSVPEDFGVAIGLWRADGFPLRWMPPKNYENLYQGATDEAAPQFFTVIDQTIYIGPTSNETSDSYLLFYEKRLTPLVQNTDVPAIPNQHHYLLVTGALSLGLMLNNDFTFQFLQAGWQQGIEEMRREWLNDQRGDVAQWGRDDVEALPTFWGV